MARPLAVSITLSDADRAVLVGWTRRRKTAQALALRARIVLAAADPGTNADPRPFVWTRTADEILASVARYCRRTTDSHH